MEHSIDQAAKPDIDRDIDEDGDASVDAGGDTDPPRSIRGIVINAIVSVAVLGLCLFGYTFLGERKRPDRAKRPKSPVTIVTTEPLEPHRGPVSIRANGVVVPLREIRLATEVAGRVVKQSENLRPGRVVDAGETLIQIDSIEYELEVQRLQAQANQESSELAAAEVSIENTKQLLQLSEQQWEIAKSEKSRIDLLVRRQAASATEVDAAKRSELTAKQALVELENRRRDLVAQRQLIGDKKALTDVQLMRARLDLSRCEVQSPIKGIIVESMVEEQTFVPAGMTFVTIEDTSAVEVRANLTSDQMIWIWSSRDGRGESSRASGRVPQVPATISCKLGAEIFQWDAFLERIDGAGIDPNTRTYPCLFRVDVPAVSNRSAVTRRLTRGMFVGVSIQADPNRSLHRVSESAIRPGNRVWLNVDGALRVVPVTVVSRIDDTVVVELSKISNPADTNIEESLAAARIATVITSPISDPIDGMPVGTGRNQPEPSSRTKKPAKVVDRPSDVRPKAIHRGSRRRETPANSLGHPTDRQLIDQQAST